MSEDNEDTTGKDGYFAMPRTAGYFQGFTVGHLYLESPLIGEYKKNKRPFLSHFTLSTRNTATNYQH